MFSDRFSAISYAIRTSPVYVAVFLMRFSFAFTVVALQYIAPIPYQRGIIAAAYPLMEMLTGLFFGILADKIGRKWIIVGAMLFSSVITYSFTLTSFFPYLVIIHALQGICAAAIITTTLASLTDIAKPETRGREMGLYDFCTVGGYGMGFVFSLLLIGGSVSRALLPFYAGAAIAVVGGLASAFLLKDERPMIGKTVPIAKNIRKILTNEKTLTLAATWFVVTILIGVGLTYTRELFSVLMTTKTLGLFAASSVSGQPTRIGVLVAVLFIFGILLLGFSQTSLGGLSDKFGRSKLSVNRTDFHSRTLGNSSAPVGVQPEPLSCNSLRCAFSKRTSRLHSCRAGGTSRHCARIG